jgi:hypothetical protein
VNETTVKAVIYMLDNIKNTNIKYKIMTETIIGRLLEEHHYEWRK